MVRGLASFASVVPFALAATSLRADPPVADPAAAQAFAEVVEAFRSSPAVECTSTVSIELEQGGQKAPGREVVAELLSLPAPDGAPPNAPRRGVLKLRDFTCIVADGTVTAVHESTKDSRYFTMSDDGSPYYALLTSFMDLPLPEVALAFGESDPAETLMQLHPAAPTVQPVAIEDGARDDGSPTRRIRFAGEGQQMVLEIDPATRLPRSLELVLTSGPMVQSGATLTYRHRFDMHRVERIDPDALTFDPGLRQKVDLMAGLVKRAEPDPALAAGDAAEAPAGGNRGALDLVGQAVPALTLPSLDGEDVALQNDRRRVMVLDFWATWCGPCRAALPGVHAIARKMKDEQLPVDFYTVNVWERAETPEQRRELVRTFWNDAKHTLPILLDDGAAAKAFRLTGIPTTVVVRSDGTIEAVHVGFDPGRLEDDVRKAIAALEGK
ncbi:MAG: TlpA family protein disulfide reductase [Phycisphaerales bacterium]|nr:TlpA family protein disulfide reductase [Phycisphaerales bacterium]